MHKIPDVMQNIIIFGASGHGSVVLDCLKKEGEYTFIGYIDSFQKKGSQHNGYPILGSEYDLPYLIEKHRIFGGIVAIGDNWTRKIIVDRLLKIAPNFKFISAIHPDSSVGMNVSIGKGTIIMPGAIINANSIIGDFCIVNTNASLDHDGFMENYSSLAPRACVAGHFWLGKFSAICLGANVIENVTIGRHTKIGAGSLVMNDIGDNVIAYGTPAKVIRKRAIGESYLKTNKFFKAIPIRTNDY